MSSSPASRPCCKQTGKGDIEAQRELIRIHQFHTKLERQSPRQGAAEQIVDVHLKIGDETIERRVEEFLIEERIKERKAQGFG